MQRGQQAGEGRDDVGGRVAQGDGVDLRAGRGGEEGWCEAQNGAAVGGRGFGEDDGDARGIAGRYGG